MTDPVSYDLTMVRVVPSDRLEQLIEVAAATFVEHGFQRTQMDDIARRLGVSKGTIYRSVESKEALFAAVLTYADEPAALPEGGQLATIEWPELSVRLRDGLAGGVGALELAAAIAPGSTPRRSGVGDEVERLALDVYSMLADRRVTLMVLDRCASEIADITSDWYELGRYALVDMWARYLRQRQELVATSVNHDVLARTIVELITLWAVKMPWDPAPRPYPTDPGNACATMIRSLATGGNP